MVLWNMHKGGVNKLKTWVQILELFQGADLVLLTKTWHFSGQHLSNVEMFDSLAIRRTMQLGKTKMIKHSRGVVAYFRNHLNPNLSQWKEGNHNFYLWLWVNRGAALDLFVCVVYVAPISSKHKSESLFQNLAANIAEVQTLGGIILLRGDFNTCTIVLLDTIDTSNLVNCCRHLSLLKLSNQALWLNDRTVTPLLAVRVASS
jgi:hypothetical protein